MGVDGCLSSHFVFFIAYFDYSRSRRRNLNAARAEDVWLDLPISYSVLGKEAGPNRYVYHKFLASKTMYE